MNMAGIEKQGTPDFKFQYNGKEKQEEIGFIDYGARHYDASLGRWFVLDPHSESYASISNYTYLGNYPVNKTDPNGKDWDDVMAAFEKLNRLQERKSQLLKDRREALKLADENPNDEEFFLEAVVSFDTQLGALNNSISDAKDDAYKEFDIAEDKAEYENSSKGDNKTYYVYRTQRTAKAGKNMPGVSGNLAYFGITTQDPSHLRYNEGEIQKKEFLELYKITGPNAIKIARGIE